MHNRPRPSRPPGRRDGVILVVVLSLLTLLAIVGITFQLYGATGKPVLREFRAEAEAVVELVGVMTTLVGQDLRDALRDDADFSDSITAIDDMADRTAMFKAGVRAAVVAETDSARRAALVELCDDLENLQLEISLLRRLIEELESSR